MKTKILIIIMLSGLLGCSFLNGNRHDVSLETVLLTSFAGDYDSSNKVPGKIIYGKKEAIAILEKVFKPIIFELVEDGPEETKNRYARMRRMLEEGNAAMASCEDEGEIKYLFMRLFSEQMGSSYRCEEYSFDAETKELRSLRGETEFSMDEIDRARLSLEEDGK